MSIHINSIYFFQNIFLQLTQLVKLLKLYITWDNVDIEIKMAILHKPITHQAR